MKVKTALTVAAFLLLQLFVAKVQGDGGFILQPVQTPASGQAYTCLENVEIWLVYNPDKIQHREVKAFIDGKETALSLKNITFCEAWQMPAEVWTANVSLPPGEHTCQYFYVQSVKQADGLWTDFNVQTTNPFKFYIVGEEQPLAFGEPQAQVGDAANSQTPGLAVKVAGFCLLLTPGLGLFLIKTRGKLANRKKAK